METNESRPSPGDRREAADTVEVIVNGEPWIRVLDLCDAGPDDPVYVLDPESGRITFGDGVYGRKPEVGGNNFIAYRDGAGSGGNIAKRIEDESDLTGFWVVVRHGCQAVGWATPPC